MFKYNQVYLPIRLWKPPSIPVWYFPLWEGLSMPIPMKLSLTLRFLSTSGKEWMYLQEPLLSLSLDFMPFPSLLKLQKTIPLLTSWCTKTMSISSELVTTIRMSKKICQTLDILGTCNLSKMIESIWKWSQMSLSAQKHLLFGSWVTYWWRFENLETKYEFDLLILLYL